MTKNDFFNILIDKLAYIPEKKLQNTITYYENTFEKEFKLGKTENEIINSFGDIDILIKKIISDDNFCNNSFQNDYNLKADTFPTKSNLVLGDDVSKNTASSANLNINSQVSFNEETTDNTKVNSVLKIIILILCFIIFFPIISTFIAFIIALIGTSIGLCLGSIGILIGRSFSLNAQAPAFIAHFPYNSLVFFCLGTICISIFLLISIIYSIKATIITLRKLFIKLI